MRKRLLNLSLLSFLPFVFALGNSPYIKRVFEYAPAPGQFVNTLPKYDIDDTPASMALKAENAIADNNLGMVSLGGYGGSVVVGFDHIIANVANETDFKVLGNAFWASANPNPNASARGGSCEPGIVMVSVDVNKNGLPDDEWYELAGSEYKNPATIKNYEIKYYKPDEHKVPTPDRDYAFLNDTTYIRWTTNGYGNGYVLKNTFHAQSYWPQWIVGDSLKIKGTKLANNYMDESGNGSYYVQYSYSWGYADNAPNTDAMSNMDISWAVDKNGIPVILDGIDFIKVYTGVNQYCGWLGETSTEIMGITDLHPDAPILTKVNPENVPPVLIYTSGENLFVTGIDQVKNVDVCNAVGLQMLRINGLTTESIGISSLPKGVYMIKVSIDTGSYTQKIIKR